MARVYVTNKQNPQFNEWLKKGIYRKLQYIGRTIVADIRSHWSAKSPSRPGRPPAIVTGLLNKSIYYTVTKNSKFRYILKVGVRPVAFYGLFLEEGTRRMAARPFLRTAMKRVLGRIRVVK